MKTLLFLLLFWYSVCLQAQVQGRVTDLEGQPISGAWIAAPELNLSTTSDSLGNFIFSETLPENTRLTAGSLGYLTDSLRYQKNQSVVFKLQIRSLREFEVRSNAGSRDEMSVRSAELISTKDLMKDACCNLSESFENSAAVDANYADAVSGARTIKLLGLDGIYTQVVTENVPSIRSLGNTFGMAYLPGPWMQSIQINKGAGSVVNGYESLTGQINIEFKKPNNSPKLLVNVFLNQDLRTEVNLVGAKVSRKNPKWSTLTALHTQQNWWKRDMNHDHFIDNPLLNQGNLMHRWTYMSGKTFNWVAVINATAEERKGGQTQFDFRKDKDQQNAWGLKQFTTRLEAMMKTGFSFRTNSLGIQYKFTHHRQNGFLGSRDYSAISYYGYTNIIFQQNLPKEGHQIKAGVSYQVEDLNEALDSFHLKRREHVPGIFAEYTAAKGKKLNAILGMRADYHNLFGWFWSPRFNLRYNPLHSLSFRIAAGRGYHVPTLFAENYSLLMNFRTLVLPDKIRPEIAWNYGISISHQFYIGFRPASWGIDFFRTDFENQLIPNLENPRKLEWNNLNGKSFSNSLQLEFNISPIDRLDIRLAYKFDDVRASIQGQLLQWAMKPRHKTIGSFEYSLLKPSLRFNTHLTWYGLARIPSTLANETANQRPAFSGNFVLWNAQITWQHKGWEVYAGAENLLNYTQPNAIIDGHGTPGSQFDASLVWGPLRGAMAFAGMRFTLK